MKTILVVGTGDTKAPELAHLKECMEQEGAGALMMSVGVLGDPPFAVEFDRHRVAAAAGATIADLIALDSENDAMIKMAAGAARLAVELYAQRRIDGLLVLGGSMGTDLALDVASALPLGVPKVIVSSIAFSHMIPPERIAPDLMMMLWPGGLYGLNGICKAALSQAAGAVCGAARTASAPDASRPLVGVTALGKSCLRYMVRLASELEKRGFEAAVFHATGMGGRAFEAIAAQGGFAAVMDFCVQEVTNHCFGSVISAGPDRMRNAGRVGIPQLAAPGAIDMIDIPGGREPPPSLRARKFRPHNRLIWSTLTTPRERRRAARDIAARLAHAKGPVKFLLPSRGIEEWDRAGEPHRDRAGLRAMIDEFRKSVRPPVELIEIDAHINDDAFVDCALAQFDAWLSAGVIRPVPLRETAAVVAPGDAVHQPASAQQAGACP